MVNSHIRQLFNVKSVDKYNSNTNDYIERIYAWSRVRSDYALCSWCEKTIGRLSLLNNLI